MSGRVSWSDNLSLFLYTYIYIALFVLNFPAANLPVWRLKGWNTIAFSRPAPLAALCDVILEVWNPTQSVSEPQRGSWHSPSPTTLNLCIHSGQARKCFPKKHHFSSFFSDFYTTWKKLACFWNQEINYTARKIIPFQVNLCRKMETSNNVSAITDSKLSETVIPLTKFIVAKAVNLSSRVGLWFTFFSWTNSQGGKKNICCHKTHFCRNPQSRILSCLYNFEGWEFTFTFFFNCFLKSTKSFWVNQDVLPLPISNLSTFWPAVLSRVSSQYARWFWLILHCSKCTYFWLPGSLGFACFPPQIPSVYKRSTKRNNSVKNLSKLCIIHANRMQKQTSYNLEINW